jgi:hypothetical protein
MRFRAPSNAQNTPGRQVGFMYFPAPHERGGNQTTPAMAEAGMGQHQGMGQQHQGGGMHMPMPQTGGADSLPSPPPAYHPQGKFQPVSSFMV